MSTPIPTPPSRRLRRLGLVLAAASVAALTLFSAAMAGSNRNTIELQDKCDPVSFTANIPKNPDGSDGCVGKGKITFASFIDRLLKKQEHNQWRFTNDHLKVKAGEPINLVNTGGEFHTFSLVEEFGPGFVPPLNELSGFGFDAVPVGGCLLEPGETNAFLLPGQTSSISTGSGGTLPSGMYNFQCCIHPWMKAVVTVKP